MRSSGYTILELLITVSIIGILAAVVAPTYLDTQANAKLVVSKSNMIELKQGIINSYFKSIFAGRGGEFPAEPSDNLMTNSWATSTLLFDGRTVAQLYNSNQIAYNPYNHPYRYAILPADSVNQTGFEIEDLDMGLTMRFRP